MTSTVARIVSMEIGRCSGQSLSNTDDTVMLNRAQVIRDKMWKQNNNESQLSEFTPKNHQKTATNPTPTSPTNPTSSTTPTSPTTPMDETWYVTRDKTWKNSRSSLPLPFFFIEKHCLLSEMLQANSAVLEDQKSHRDVGEEVRDGFAVVGAPDGLGKHRRDIDHLSWYDEGEWIGKKKWLLTELHRRKRKRTRVHSAAS